MIGRAAYSSSEGVDGLRAIMVQSADFLGVGESVEAVAEPMAQTHGWRRCLALVVSPLVAGAWL